MVVVYSIVLLNYIFWLGLCGIVFNSFYWFVSDFFFDGMFGVDSDDWDSVVILYGDEFDFYCGVFFGGYFRYGWLGDLIWCFNCDDFVSFVDY